MPGLLEFVESIRLLDAVEAVVTTGDAEYPGTTMEVTDSAGNDLFHFVVDQRGERQLLVFPSESPYRLSLDRLERLLARAKQTVTHVPDEP